ncbi:Lysophospholipase L1 [Caldanaerobius fijiensis DSM 17918]|uniref:Lysophospholipase L1 n=2 Tax=Caldanaerobius TaxID=862261 RepID=A0A1M5C2S7_9THEO|nr:SGNH/GDSL hydrolase family protein [Caldanaerobius fijiensis]SHF49039.1 Lysophospholipase L1 [Caldanaerobius fijiensis DSM 17918]
MLLKDGELVLFQGDSITDAGRNRNDINDLGLGYPMFIASWFSALYPDKNVRFINRGISGDRVRNLKARWQEDCLDLKPDWISILIGINDCWRRYDSNDPTSVEAFESDYRYILDQVKEKLNAKIILCEPFVLPTPEDRVQWREDLDPKIHVVRKLAREYGAIFIPLDGIMAQACARKEPAFWAADGVHPTPAGHALIAQAWLKAVGAL